MKALNSCRMLFDETEKSFESMGIVIDAFSYTMTKVVANLGNIQGRPSSGLLG